MAAPGTLEHFREWSQRLILDTGEPWEIEDWQEEIAGEILSGVPITWEVVPEGNGKTTLSAGIGLYQLDPDGWGHPTPMVVVAASTSKQAEWMYIQAAGFVQRTPELSASLRCLGGFKRIERIGDKLARMDVFAGDDKAADDLFVRAAALSCPLAECRGTFPPLTECSGREKQTQPVPSTGKPVHAGPSAYGRAYG